MFHSALQWRQKNLPAANIEIAYSLNNLGEVRKAMGCCAARSCGISETSWLRAATPPMHCPYFEQSVVIHEKTLGAEHPATASLLLDYSSASLRAGNKSMAHKLRKRAAELVARLKAQSPPQMTVSVRDLRAAK